MKLPRATVLLAACVVLVGWLAACASTPPETRWEGRRVEDAIAAYGPPTRVAPSNTGKTYVWESRHTMQGMGGFPGATRETRVTRRMMTVNSSGVITSYNFVGQ
ncbi:MAG: hypothetical protein B7Z61_07275 [Acidobacteria bacterium 37-71-11]|nr:MAG: hypothetical protein B7Z61_07275 [Acidobacteria bacterium 37-71-11]HQT93993.1 hypothetical protein [Thermoanaerobaculaceae bacterium]